MSAAGAHVYEEQPRRRGLEGATLVVQWAYAGDLDGVDRVSDAARRELVLAVGPRRATEPVRRIFTAPVGLELLETIPGAGDDELKERLATNPDGFLVLVACHARRS